MNQQCQNRSILKLNQKIYLFLLILIMIQRAQSAMCSVSIAHCNSCYFSDRTACSACNTGYGIVGKQCCITPCTTCLADSVTCFTCSTGNCISGTNCLQCSSFVANCSECSSCGICTKCQSPSFALTSPTLCESCSSLMADCLECSSSTMCTKCSNSTLAVDSSPTPNTCVPCSNFISNCNTCGMNAIVGGVLWCFTCVDNTYAVNSTDHKCYTCSTLMSNCLNCTSQTSCTQCMTTYAIYLSTCHPCSSLMNYCVNCTSASVCVECANNSVVLNDSKCLLCSVFLTGCATCSSATVCLTCLDTGYLIMSNVCVACSSFMVGCLNCTSNSTCTACIPNNYIFNSTTNQCDPCSSLMSHCANCSSVAVCTLCNTTLYAPTNTSYQCEVCGNFMSNCLRCNSSGICVDCIDNRYAINITNNKCAPCAAFISFCLNCSNSSYCINCDGAPNIIFNGKKCVYCKEVIPNCLNCTTKTTCTLCAKYYMVNSTHSCVLCAIMISGCMECSSQTVCTRCIYGEIVSGGCSSTPGCIRVGSGNLSSTCNLCDSTNYYPNPVKGACICLKGHLAGQYCTEIVGCSNVVRSAYGQACISCDRSNHFYISGEECMCQKYYQQNGQICTQICGDGILITLPCDDGNLVDGDGCSSSCQIEAGYHCNGSIIAPSVCIYEGDVKLQSVCVYKQQDNNAQIILTTNPYIPNIVKSKTTIIFGSNKQCQMNTYSFIDSRIILQISFSEDMEGENVNVTIEYDKNYIISPHSTINIRLEECKENKLIYDPNPSKSLKSTTTFLTETLSALVLLTWFLGSYSHKMIGVQTLHTFQFIFVSHAFSARYYPVIVYFSQLSNVLNIYQRKVTPSAVLSSKQQQRLKYSSDFFNNYSVVFSLQIVALLALGIFTYISQKNVSLQQPRSPKRKQKEENICSNKNKAIKAKQFIYNSLVFPIFIGFFLNLILSLMVYCKLSNKKILGNIFVQSLTALFSVFFGFFIYFSQFFNKDQRQFQWSYKRHYIQLYLTNLLILCFFIEGSVISLVSHPIQLFIGLSLTYTVGIFIYKPYRNWFHNLGICINNLGVLANLCWVLSQRYIYLTKAREELIGILLIGWMFLILIIAIVRIILELRKKQRKLKDVIQEVNKGKKQQNYQMQIYKAIESQINSSKNGYLVESQLLRFKMISEQQQKERRRNELYQLSNRLIGQEERINYDISRNFNPTIRIPLRQSFLSS